MQVTRAAPLQVRMKPTTRALKVAVPVQTGNYQLRVANLSADPYATTEDGLFFDLHDNNQLSWPKAHKASIWRDDCKVIDFVLIKDDPLVPALSTTTDCKQDWKPTPCTPSKPPHPCDPPKRSCKSGCSCADLQGATCVSCLTTTTTVAVHAPAY